MGPYFRPSPGVLEKKKKKIIIEGTGAGGQKVFVSSIDFHQTFIDFQKIFNNFHVIFIDFIMIFR